MTVAYIAIGSNLASPLEQVNAALKALGDIPESHILAVSSFYAVILSVFVVKSDLCKC